MEKVLLQDRNKKKSITFAKVNKNLKNEIPLHLTFFVVQHDDESTIRHALHAGQRTVQLLRHRHHAGPRGLHLDRYAQRHEHL